MKIELANAPTDKKDTVNAPGVIPWTISVGKLLTVDTVNRVGSVLIFGESSARYVSLGGVATQRSSVETVEGYTVGDTVLVAFGRQESMLAAFPQQIQGVIVCKIAVTNTAFDEFNPNTDTVYDPGPITKLENASPVARLYNDNLFGVSPDAPATESLPIAQFPPIDHVSNHIGQAYNITGNNTNVCITHNDIRLDAGDCRLTLTALGMRSSKTLWVSDSWLGGMRTNHLIEDTVLDVTRQTTEVSGGYFRISKYGALSDGLSDAILAPDGRSLFRLKTGLQGVVKIDAAAGAVVERGGTVNVDTESSRMPIDKLDEVDKKAISSAKKSNDFIEDGITYSKSVQESNKPLKPLDTPTSIDKVSHETFHNKYSDRDVHAVKGRARYGLMPDGSFVVSDAWGSEIRLFGGDIFITPARRLMLTAPSDIIMSSGEGVALTGRNVVNIGSIGSLELVADNISMCGKTDTSITGMKSVNMSSKDVLIAAGSTLNMTSAENCSIVAGEALSEIGAGVNIVGTETAAIASRYSALKLKDSQIELAGSDTVVRSDLLISDSRASGFTVGDVQVTPAGGSGLFYCDGYSIFSKGLTVNSWAKIHSQVSADSVMVSTVNREAIGVFKGKKPQKESAKVRGSIHVNSSDTPDLSEVRSTFDPSIEVVNKVFKSEPSSAYVVVPGIVKGNGELVPIFVETSGGVRYIYPGKDFWVKNGLYTISPETYYNLYDTPDMKVSGMDGFNK